MVQALTNIIRANSASLIRALTTSTCISHSLEMVDVAQVQRWALDEQGLHAPTEAIWTCLSEMQMAEWTEKEDVQDDPMTLLELQRLLMRRLRSRAAAKRDLVNRLLANSEHIICWIDEHSPIDAGLSCGELGEALTALGFDVKSSEMISLLEALDGECAGKITSDDLRVWLALPPKAGANEASRTPTGRTRDLSTHLHHCSLPVIRKRPRPTRASMDQATPTEGQISYMPEVAAQATQSTMYKPALIARGPAAASGVPSPANISAP